MDYLTTMRFDSIFVVESLRPGDLKTGEDLHDRVLVPQRFGKNVGVQLITAPTRDDFFAALRSVRDEFARAGHSPVLHIEAHGDESGIQLRDDSVISWEELRVPLAEINEASRMNFLVFSALCSGAYLVESINAAEPSPVWAIVGPKTVVTAGDLSRAAERFYEEMFKSFDLRAAMNALNETTLVADWRFSFLHAELLFSIAFGLYAKQELRPEVVAERVAEIVARLVRERGLNVVQSAAARLEITAAMADVQGEYTRLRARFLMLDRWPENEERFPLKLEDALAGRDRI